MKINHKDSYFDFGEQFEIDNKIDGFMEARICF